ncbi:MAG TPA: hypothetical protein VN032_00450 [Thermoanaerobaculia bacterium]|jgi:photosystem II stability/assembly factor-like uncharacterized protein|nr:hypothetical protein [Thermoanaerobaculia bacterium]
MPGKVRRAGLAALALCLAVSAAAEDPGFVLRGEGGLVTAFALDPSSSSTVYAATARGLYKTVDAGATWRRAGAGLRNHALLALAVEPLSPSNLYATTDTGGVFRSEDGGEHWAEANTGITARYVGSVAVDPHRRGGVYVGAEAGRIFHSTDGAVSWTELTPPTAHVGVTVIGLDPAMPERLYAGTNSQGIFWTVDGGVTWSRPVGRLSRGSVWNLTFDRGTGEIFAGTHDGLFRSADHGATWTACNKGLRSWNVLSIVTDPAAPATMYAGTAAAIYKSADRGQSWTELRSDLYVTALAIDPQSPSTLYAATQLGVIKSDTAGEKWRALPMAGPVPVPVPVPDQAIREPQQSPEELSDKLPLLPLKRRPPAPAGLAPLPVRTPRTG